MKKILLLALCMSLATIAHAQEDVATTNQTGQAVKALVYVPGKTSFEEIYQYWQDSQAKILAQGYLAVGNPSVRDNGRRAYDKSVELFDVDGVDFEGLTKARFMFYKGKLYGIQTRLRTGLRVQNPEDLNMSDEEQDALEKILIKKYGKPHSSQRTFFAPGKKPDVLTWNLKENRLIFSTTFLSAALILKNTAFEKEIERNRKNVCKEFNTKDSIICR